MLVLWVKEGESELFVSLFNQRGTINLSKICKSLSRMLRMGLTKAVTIEDFESFRKEPTPGLVLSLVFPSIAVIISVYRPSL